MKGKIALKSIGNNIQLARLKRGLTQEKCDISTKYISALERGISAGSISLIIDICNILEISPNYIFKDVINTNVNDSIDIIDKKTLIKYEKLKIENKNFINETISHLYNMQKRR